MSTASVWRPISRPHSTVIKILTCSLAVYLSALKSGRFCFRTLVRESGLVCDSCGTTDCARRHGTWYRKRVVDLCSGRQFDDLPILRVRFCKGPTKSLFPAELWRGRATVSSVLESVSDAIDGGIESALQHAVDAADGDEPISERTLRRWIKRATARVPVVASAMDFSLDDHQHPAAKLESFLRRLHLDHLLDLRRRWGFAILDTPWPEKSAHKTTSIKPGFPDPRPPQSPPSAYLHRGARSRLARRGRSPDEQSGRKPP